MTECTPQELLPIIPPRLQYSCVEGSGPKVRLNSLARLRSLSSTQPGCTHAYFSCGIDFDNLVQVLGEIHDHGNVAGLSAEAGAAAARQQRRVVLAGQSHSLNYFFNCFGNDNADWNLTIVRSIDGIESAGAIVKADFAGDGGAQIGSEGICALLLASALLQSWVFGGMGNDYDMPKLGGFTLPRVNKSAANYAVCLVMVEIEKIPVQVLYGELPQSPGLFFQRLHDVRT